ncbi:glucose 1-dehydrogenase [Planosporangium flavigriseum]|uniref:Threonine dehydrogenase n=1 Tax=Planosporangium flavigriseum TaxID=373681 RepID=A0A8J3LUS0_9ACTN|nr:glucose 1-dehydrogenase [Planosporangium flavigriseum]NJC66978.1 glucose 1-dehydrogenase [Planosporangium flavigriseum]GIG73956.1 threonine dehydrogenase [Planosporangium flavigriseum]
MRALTVRPGTPKSLALTDLDDPPPTDGRVLVESLQVGLCGTDEEIVAGEYGEAPPGEDLLVLGHENLGRIIEAPKDSNLKPGDLVVGIVRRPDPVPCPACAVGEWDMCRNGRYTEHGIKALHGFARERWRAEPDAMVRLDPDLADVGALLEPTTIVAKAWEQIDRIGRRAFWQPETAAITGAGPVGLLAALLSVQRGLNTHVFDIVKTGLKPELVEQLGAAYHSETLPDSGVEADIIVECSGVPSVIVDAMTCSAHNSVVCLTGVSSGGTRIPLDIGEISRTSVLENDVIFGSVNANRRHYQAATVALAAADKRWLSRLITRRMPLADFLDAFDKRPDDVKVVLELAAK